MEELIEKYREFMDKVATFEKSENSLQNEGLIVDILSLHRKALLYRDKAKLLTISKEMLTKQEEGKAYFIRSNEKLGEKATATAKEKFAKCDEEYLNILFDFKKAQAILESYDNLIDLVGKHFYFLKNVTTPLTNINGGQ